MLGPTVIPDGLIVTVWVGSSLFDDRFGLAAQRPAQLTPMRSFPDDNLDPAQCHGDLCIQLTGGHNDIVLHALRDIARFTRGGMQVRWRIDGFASPPRPGRQHAAEPDGLHGRDLQPARGRRTEMDSLIWARPRRRRRGPPAAATWSSG